MTEPHSLLLPRRAALVLGSAVAALGIAAPAIARTRLLTPRQTEGPFYPDRLPVDQDANLLQVAGRRPYRKGPPAIVEGRVLTPAGAPRAGVKVEIWQCDADGRYHHTRDGPADPDFQGYGYAVTDRDGRYRFLTLRPAPYSGRTPHIHFKLSADGRDLLTTQMYVAGDPRNRRDGLFMSLPPAARRAVEVSFAPAPKLGPQGTAGKFDLVVRS